MIINVGLGGFERFQVLPEFYVKDFVNLLWKINYEWGERNTFDEITLLRGIWIIIKELEKYGYYWGENDGTHYIEINKKYLTDKREFNLILIHELAHLYRNLIEPGNNKLNYYGILLRSRYPRPRLSSLAEEIFCQRMEREFIDIELLDDLFLNEIGKEFAQ